MLKSCPYCAEQIQDAAIVCKHCGRQVAAGVLPPQAGAVGSAHVAQWSPGVAAVLSLVIPGAGQMYKGQVGLGLLWLIVTPVGYLFFIVPGLVLHLACIVTAASGTPASSAPAPTAALTPEQLAASARLNRNVLIGLVGLVVLVALASAYAALSTQRSHAASSAGTSPITKAEELGQAVRSAGSRCAFPAKRAFLQGRRGAEEVWNVMCGDDLSYVVQITGTDTKVLACETMSRVTGTPCFVEFKAQK